MALPLPCLAILSALLALGTYWDVARRRVPNLLVVCVAVSGLVSQAVLGGARGLGSAVAAMAIVVALLWLPWSKGILGGGDLKLAAAAGGWIGLEGLATYLLASALAGGILSAFAWARSDAGARSEMRANLIQVRVTGQLSPIAPSGPGRVSVPYVAAIAIGALVSLGLRG
jgi:prepilin peptidase CpaA